MSILSFQAIFWIALLLANTFVDQMPLLNLRMDCSFLKSIQNVQASGLGNRRQPSGHEYLKAGEVVVFQKERDQEASLGVPVIATGKQT